MKKQSTRIIACATVMEEILPLLPPDVECKKVEPALHLYPDKLKASLQDLIDEITADTEIIILGYGLCSMAAVGLKANESTLIIPCVDDCVSMFLGGQKFYKRQLEKEPGTYFLSKGWIDAGVTLIDELRQTEDRLGKSAAEKIKKRMLKEYKRLAYIDMGHDNQEYYREFARKAAEELNLKYKEIKGTTELMSRMLNGPWDDKFIVAPPGYVVTLYDFKR